MKTNDMNNEDAWELHDLKMTTTSSFDWREANDMESDDNNIRCVWKDEEKTMFPESVHQTDMPCEMETATKLTIHRDDRSPVVDENANQCVCPLAKFQKFGQCLQYMLTEM